MTTNLSIIERVKELLTCSHAPNLYGGEKCYEIKEKEFKAIAEAFIAMDGKLKIAETALQKAEHSYLCSKTIADLSGNYTAQCDCEIPEALALLHRPYEE